MDAALALRDQWLHTRDRLVAKDLLRGAAASLSLRIPGGTSMWFGTATAAGPTLIDGSNGIPDEQAAAQQNIYAQRADIGAIACGGGPFGACLAEFGGLLPQAFDEQARHIGPMAPAIQHPRDIATALRNGGNAQLLANIPLCFGTTPTRLALNAELFEKCAKAYVLAAATGGRIQPLPWWVRRIANSRLKKDQRRAAEAFARGELPPESRGY